MALSVMASICLPLLVLKRDRETSRMKCTNSLFHPKRGMDGSSLGYSNTRQVYLSFLELWIPWHPSGSLILTESIGIEIHTNRLGGHRSVFSV